MCDVNRSVRSMVQHRYTKALAHVVITYCTTNAQKLRSEENPLTGGTAALSIAPAPGPGQAMDLPSLDMFTMQMDKLDDRRGTICCSQAGTCLFQVTQPLISPGCC